MVENRAGSNGNIAGELVARSAPDGYTLLFGADSLIAINPHLYANMAFRSLTDLAPVAATITSQLILSVHPSLPVRNFKEFLDLRAATRPPLQYASAGNGSQHHLSVEMLKQRAGIDLDHVPYKAVRRPRPRQVAGEVPDCDVGHVFRPARQGGQAARPRRDRHQP